MSRFIIIFIGKVQRVGFRYFVYQCADEYGLTGYVRNLNDGGVEVQAQGKDENIAAFLNHVKEGNGRSQVKDFSQIKINMIKEEENFVIK